MSNQGELAGLFAERAPEVSPVADPGAGAPLGVRAEPESPTALKVDRWGMRRGRELAKDWAGLGAGETDPNTGQPVGGDPLGSIDDLDEAQHVAADVLTSLFDSRPRMAERPEDAKRAAWLKQMMETPEYKSLHARTVHSPFLSKLGAAELARSWATYAAETEGQEGPGEGEGDGGEGEDPAQTIGRLRSTRNALKAAEGEVDTAESTAAGLGLGGGAGGDTEAVAKAFRAVRGNPRLRGIMEWAGRYIARARSLQATRVDARRQELTGVELSGDVARLLPSELALITGAVPEAQLLALYRLATRRALSYKHTAKEDSGRGPIVVGVDESGSMQGQRIAAAKGLALAMAWVAREQKRPCYVYGFSGEARVWGVDAADRDKLLTWAGMFDGGGTVLDGPLSTVPRRHWPKGDAGARADHIIITDGAVQADDSDLAAYRTWAQTAGVRTWAIGVGVSSLGGLAEVADRGWCLRDLSMGQDAITEVLSIGPDAPAHAAGAPGSNSKGGF